MSLSLSDIDPQGCFLYDDLWDAEMDTLLLDILLQHRDAVYVTPTYHSTHVLHIIIGTLSQKYGKRLSLGDVEERISFLEGRYSTFTQIMALKKTNWDQKSNCILAAKGVWREIIKEDEFAKAYYRKGEPEYRKLAMLFDKAIIKHEENHSVIIISDSLTQRLDTEVLPMEISDDDVTSPLTLNTTKSCRKLKYPNEDDAKAPVHGEDDAESVICSGHNEAMPKNWNKHPKKPFTSTSKSMGGTKEFDGSSCASCSPFK